MKPGKEDLDGVPSLALNVIHLTPWSSANEHGQLGLLMRALCSSTSPSQTEYNGAAHLPRYRFSPLPMFTVRRSVGEEDGS